MFNQVSSVFFGVRTLLNDSIEQFATSHSLEREKRERIELKIALQKLELLALSEEAQLA